MRILSLNDVIERVRLKSPQRQYLAMYSTLWDGCVLDPELMMIPIDDHMVHRGDGVFEAMRVTPQKIFLMREHLDRLFQSASRIFLEVPKVKDEIAGICEQLCKLADVGPSSSTKKEGMIRLFVGRGPGDFSPNPYATLGSQIYVVVTPFKSLPDEKYARGVKVFLSKVAAKPAEYAQIKSCNYLPNVLLKKDAVDNDCDFAISVTQDGYVTEGPTENIMIITNNGDLVAPRFDYTLKGTTLLRTMTLASSAGFKNIRFDDLTVEDLLSAKEVMMVGTTLAVLPVTKVGDVKIGEAVGEGARMLNELLLADMGY